MRSPGLGHVWAKRCERWVGSLLQGPCMLMLVTDLVRPHLHMAKNKMATIVRWWWTVRDGILFWRFGLKRRIQCSPPLFLQEIHQFSQRLYRLSMAWLIGGLNKATQMMMVVDLWRRRLTSVRSPAGQHYELWSWKWDGPCETCQTFYVDLSI